MADILNGARGFNRESVSKLIAAYGNDLVDVDSGTGFGLNLTDYRKVEFEVFLEALFFQNFEAAPLSYDGSVWTSTHVARMPIGTFLKNYGSRLYTGYIKLLSTNYPSRIWYSDLPKNNTIQWGLEYGTTGRKVAGTNIFGMNTGGFKSYGIKVGDPLLILSGNEQGQYTVSEVIGNTQIRLLETFTQTETGLSFWVGSNWFDVRTDNNDVLTWLGENSDNLLIFKNDSLHRYNGVSLATVKDAPGTPSGRSVVNLRGGTFYFHSGVAERTGMYLYDGTDSQRISNAIDPFIKGMSDVNRNKVVGWAEGDVLRWYLGDISNEDEDIDIDKAVVSFDLVSRGWSVDPIADEIRCSTTLRESNQTKVFLGTSDAQVLQTPSGYSHNGTAIRWLPETAVVYPRGQNTVNEFTRVSVIARKAGGVNVSYRIWDDPLDVDENWYPLGDLEKDRTEFLFPRKHSIGCGVSYRFEELGSVEPTFKIESISTYSVPQRIVTPEIKSLE